MEKIVLLTAQNVHNYDFISIQLEKKSPDLKLVMKACSATNNGAPVLKPTAWSQHACLAAQTRALKLGD